MNLQLVCQKPYEINQKKPKAFHMGYKTTSPSMKSVIRLLNHHFLLKRKFLNYAFRRNMIRNNSLQRYNSKVAFLVGVTSWSTNGYSMVTTRDSFSSSGDNPAACYNYWTMTLH